MALNQIPLFSVVILFSILLISACATVQQPMGGPKDETPPKILSIVPDNLTRNFDAKLITITFDEFIKLKNEFTEISLSPDMEIAPIYKVKRKSLLITVPDSLEENTTYSINFGNAIGDFNEGNELKNFSYVFSTGPEIDSLSISGNIINGLTLEGEKDVNVLLIPVKQDSIFGKKKANIFTRTDSSGNFSLKNLHENTYRIYALKETNNDRIYNSPDELIGFLKDSIFLKENIKDIKLTLFKEIPKDFRIINRFLDKKGKISILFNKSLKNASLTILDNEKLDKEKIIDFSKTGDTASVWIPELNFDSLSIVVKEGSTILDTVKLKRNKKDEYDRKILLSDNLNAKLVNKINNIIITASAPLKGFDKSKVFFTEDSIPKENFQIYLDTTNIRRSIIKYNWKAKKNYQIKFEEGALTGYYGEKSEAIDRVYVYDETENYGDINLIIQAPDSSKNYLIQLLNDKDEVLNSKPIKGSQTLVYKNLLGTKYKVRIVYDENGNGVWDTGSLDEKRQPEKVWFWNKIITIRPNWEQEDTITIPNGISSDDQKEKLPNESQPEDEGK